ncbi:MAG: TetR family transcriptional regulator [Variibacter sp.]|nr:TetR family transcriptional regulator [Variibacter sp.]
MLDRSRSKSPGRAARAGQARKRPNLAERTREAAAKPVIDFEADTRGRIMQAAEALFAEHGFDAVSMRDITATARVNLAAINYHFGSKMALLADVIAGRAQALVEERLRLLSLVARDRQGRPRLEAVIEAFLRPSLETSQQPGGAHHMRLRARLAVERIGVTKLQFEKTFDASNAQFIEALSQALPNYPPQEIYWGFHCLLGIMTYTMANSGRIQHLSRGACDPSEVEQTLAHLVPFAVQGFRALAKR